MAALQQRSMLSGAMHSGFCRRLPVRLSGGLRPRVSGARQQIGVQARSGRGQSTTEEVDQAAEQYLDKANDYWNTVKAKWDQTEEKPAVVAIGVGTFVTIWALSGLVDRIDKLPIIGGLLELVGLLVTGWFIYRYLVFGPDREELKGNLNGFLKKVTGDSSTKL